MGTCATCKWWGKEDTTRLNKDDIGLPMRVDFRPCNHSCTGQQSGHPESAFMIGCPTAISAMIDPAVLRHFTAIFGPEFGCVHHDPK